MGSTHSLLHLVGRGALTAFAALIAVAFGIDNVRLFMDVVPVAAPNETVVAAPPILRVVAVVLNTVAVPLVAVVISFPLTAISPLVVMLPVDPATEKLVAVISFSPRDKAFTISGSDRSMAFVMPPAED